MTPYKGHDITNIHIATKNTHPTIQNIIKVPFNTWDDVMYRNCETILKITYDELLRNAPNIQFHMTYMKGNTAIAIFENRLEERFDDTFSNFVDILCGRSIHSTKKLNALVIEPTERSICGELNPEIRIIARAVTVCGKTIEWNDATYVNKNGQVASLLHNITAANRWGIVIKNLADTYPKTFSKYFTEFKNQYPQTDIKIIWSNYEKCIMLLICIELIVLGIFGMHIVYYLMPILCLLIIGISLAYFIL